MSGASTSFPISGPWSGHLLDRVTRWGWGPNEDNFAISALKKFAVRIVTATAVAFLALADALAYVGYTIRDLGGAIGRKGITLYDKTSEKLDEYSLRRAYYSAFRISDYLSAAFTAFVVGGFLSGPTACHRVFRAWHLIPIDPESRPAHRHRRTATPFVRETESPRDPSTATPSSRDATSTDEDATSVSIAVAPAKVRFEAADEKTSSRSSSAAGGGASPAKASAAAAAAGASSGSIMGAPLSAALISPVVPRS